MQGQVRSACASRRLCTEEQGGFALLEAVLVIGIAAIAILTIAIGMLTAVTANGRANRQQRLDLAMTTVVESVKREDWKPQSCPTMSSATPSTSDAALAANSATFPADFYLYKAASDPAVQAWLQPTSGRKVKFSAKRFEYWTDNPAFGSSGDGFVSTCSTKSYRWPAARMLVVGCWARADGSCDPEEPSISSEIVLRGPRGQ
jgi:type II secretory pathway pseudopilin PulG